MTAIRQAGTGDIGGARSNRTAVVAFWSSALLAGGNTVAVKFSNFELHPLWGAAFRFSLAALILWAVVIFARKRMPTGRRLGLSVVYGLLFFGVGFAFAFYGLVDLDPGFAAVILGTGPLLTLLFAVAHKQERLRLAAVAGSLAAIAGIAFMSTVTLGGNIPVLSVLAMVGAAASFSEAGVLARSVMPMDPTTLNAVGITAGAIALWMGVLVFSAPVELPTMSETWLAIAYMVVFGSVVVFNLIAVALRYWEASRVAYVLVVMPPVSIALSAWLLDEEIGVGLLGGALLVFVGVYFGALRRVSPGR